MAYIERVVILGLVLGVIGVFGVVWTTFLISRTLNAKYGRADAGLSVRATSDKTVAPSMRWLLRLFAAMAIVGVALTVVGLYG